MEIIRAHVARFYEDFFHPGFAYHNLRHTEQVSSSVLMIGESCKVSTIELRCLEIAAWFHDTGYSKNPDLHESIGADQAEAFLKSMDEPEQNITLVKSLIMATVYSASPKSLPEKIIRDADLCYLGTDDFWHGSENLRAEWAEVKNLRFTEREWVRLNISFLLSHRFYTECAQKQFGSKKQENLNQLLKTLTKLK